MVCVELALPLAWMLALALAWAWVVSVSVASAFVWVRARASVLGRAIAWALRSRTSGRRGSAEASGVSLSLLNLQVVHDGQRAHSDRHAPTCRPRPAPQ